ncbi:hypothetical protein LENED_008868 [Lentinula edodes]|uniref:Uncharacterized protein n=1 Tax=Lentinula edodes TaxID=5353 RepID=A0A1Q3EI98_LENED|nr:hypothetical protein LENED_008868 [Lentinula edodes]
MGLEHRTNSRQPPLITPSASPPSRSHSFSYNPHANIITSGKSSSSSGSSIRTGSRFSSTPLSTTETPDIPTLRSQSTSRLLSVWSTLADRYSLRVDQDDIVDIRTGQLVKDRGVVRGLNGKWDFGRFASVEDDEGDEQLEYEEDRNRGTEGVQEESEDELDSFAYLDHQQGLDGPQEDIESPANPFMTLSNLTSRATHAIDPTNDEDDAADLRAFLEEERHRKETQGDAAEQDEISTGESRIEEGGSEFVTEIDTETEAGFTTEEAIKTSSSPQNAGKSVRHKGKGQTGAGELDKNSHSGKIEPKSTAVDVKGKSKAREIIEIDSSSDELPLDSITSSSRRLSAKARGKKRARSSGASWSSAAEWENDFHQATGGSTTINHRKSKLMGSPTKKGRYTVLSDSEPEEVIHHTSAHSSCEIDPISSPAKLSPRRAPQNTHPEQRRRNDSSQSRSRQSRLVSNVQLYEDKNDDHQEKEHSPHGSFHRHRPWPPSQCA